MLKEILALTSFPNPLLPCLMADFVEGEMIYASLD